MTAGIGLGFEPPLSPLVLSGPGAQAPMPSGVASDHLAGLLTQLDFFGLDAREIDELFSRIDAVTLQDCQRVIQQYFPSEDLIFVVIGKAAEIKQSLSKYAPKIETREISQVGYK